MLVLQIHWRWDLDQLLWESLVVAVALVVTARVVLRVIVTTRIDLIRDSVCVDNSNSLKEGRAITASLAIEF